MDSRVGSLPSSADRLPNPKNIKEIDLSYVIRANDQIFLPNTGCQDNDPLSNGIIVGVSGMDVAWVDSG
jgi:hypothetical protein